MTDESAELLAYSNALANDALGVVTVFEPRLVEYRGGPTTSSWIAFIKLLASVEETLFASMSFLTLASAGVKLSSNDKNLKRRTIASLEECATSVETRQLASASASTPAKDLDNVQATIRPEAIQADRFNTVDITEDLSAKTNYWIESMNPKKYEIHKSWWKSGLSLGLNTGAVLLPPVLVFALTVSLLSGTVAHLQAQTPF